VDLKTDFGNIKSDLPVTVTLTENSSGDKEDMVGAINGGGSQLTVHANSGNITIKTIEYSVAERAFADLRQDAVAPRDRVAGSRSAGVTTWKVGSGVGGVGLGSWLRLMGVLVGSAVCTGPFCYTCAHGAKSNP